MRTKLILVEGLPGSGKSTTANFIYDILKANQIDVEIFTEGNLDHPADYEGVACFTKDEFDQMLLETDSVEWKEVFTRQARFNGTHYLLPYRKIQNEYGLSDDSLGAMFKKDIYELPFEQNADLIAGRWAEFADKALTEDKTYIFECCFIQNPITIGIVKYGEPKEKVAHYVKRLADAIERLNPVLFYVEQDDIEFSFKKAIQERPAEWATGFMEYYTGQGYGNQHGLQGLEGTLKVLKARREIEREIFDSLSFGKEIVNNSKFELEKHKTILTDKLKSFGIL